jgi:hypothetical protein
MRPEVRARIRLLTTAEGGRKGPILGPSFGCPTRIQSRYFDCRLQTTPPGPIALGETVEVQLQFLCPELALPLLAVGQAFALWEGHTIGEGIVLELLKPPFATAPGARS